MDFIECEKLKHSRGYVRSRKTLMIKTQVRVTRVEVVSISQVASHRCIQCAKYKRNKNKRKKYRIEGITS